MKKPTHEKRVTIWVTAGTRERIKEIQKEAKARDMDTVVEWGLMLLQENRRKKQGRESKASR